MDKEEQNFQQYKEKMRKKLLDKGLKVVKNANKTKSLSLETRFGWHPEYDESGYSRSFACITSDTEINSHNFRGVAPKLIQDVFGNELLGSEYRKSNRYRPSEFDVDLKDTRFQIRNRYPSDYELDECFYVPSKKIKQSISKSSVVGSQKVLQVDEPDEDYRSFLKAELEKRKKNK